MEKVYTFVINVLGYTQKRNWRKKMTDNMVGYCFCIFLGLTFWVIALCNGDMFKTRKDAVVAFILCFFPIVTFPVIMAFMVWSLFSTMVDNFMELPWKSKK